MRRIEQWIMLAVFGGLLLAPAVSGLAGVRTSVFENRELARRPAFTAASLLDQNYYAAIDSWIDDHTPLRHAAIVADARMDLGIFQDSPDPKVWLGKDGWLFYDHSLTRACEEPTTNREILARMQTIMQLLRESGRDFRWIVVPDKIALYPEFGTPRILRAQRCSAARRRDLLLRAPGTGGYLDVSSAFMQMKARFGRRLYYQDDSHVNLLGSAVLVQQLVGSLQPGLWDASALRGPSPATRMGDLADMLVARQPSRTQLYAIERSDVHPRETTTLDLDQHITLRRFRTEGPPGSLFPARTFVLHDSQWNVPMTMMRQYFADSSFLVWRGFDEARIARLMAEAQLTVVEVVERDFYWRVATQLGTEAFVEELRAALAAR